MPWRARCSRRWSALRSDDARLEPSEVGSEIQPGRAAQSASRREVRVAMVRELHVRQPPRHAPIHGGVEVRAHLEKCDRGLLLHPSAGARLDGRSNIAVATMLANLVLGCFQASTVCFNMLTYDI